MWRLTLEHSPIGMALVGTDGRLLEVNRALCEMLGYPADALLAASFQDITHPDDLAADVALLHDTVEGVRDDYRLVKRYLHAEGHLVWGDLSVALVRDAHGAPMHFIAQILDVTERRLDREALAVATAELRARGERLEWSNRDLENFAAAASHDLRSPLTVIRGYVELLFEDAKSRHDPRARGWATRAIDAADRMSSLLTALLDYASTNGEGTKPALVSLDAIVEEAVSDLAPMINGTDAVITVGGSADHPGRATEDDARARERGFRDGGEPADDRGRLGAAFGSEPLLRMLVTNLIGNAIKHRDHTRRCAVTVTTSNATTRSIGAAGQGRIELVVADNGPGIAPEHQARVFDLFQRGTDSAGSVAGHGIGMAACRRIIDWHEGDIQLSTNDSGGLTVTCSLPQTPTP